MNRPRSSSPIASLFPLPTEVENLGDVENRRNAAAARHEPNDGRKVPGAPVYFRQPKASDRGEGGRHHCKALGLPLLRREPDHVKDFRCLRAERPALIELGRGGRDAINGAAGKRFDLRSLLGRQRMGKIQDDHGSLTRTGSLRVGSFCRFGNSPLSTENAGATSG